MDNMRNRPRNTFSHCITIPTRWMDNDAYGHVNNVNYYSYFDTAVNQYLIENGALDIQKSDVVGLVVETHCQYFSPLVFPDLLHVGIRVAKIGRSSVHYELAIYKEHADQPSAAGYFVHVYVDRTSGKSVSVPPLTRQVLAPLMTKTSVRK